MAKRLWFFLKYNYLFVLAFALLFVLSVHSFNSIGQDIGRHLKVGEIIWQTKEIPKTNLFSFTEPNSPFTNHHWLSEIIFYHIFNFGGFTGLILVKVLLVFGVFLLLFFGIKKYSSFWPLLISFLLSVFIFIERTEVRPEIFSFAILSFFLFALFKAKYENKYFWLWFLPVLEILWVNFHIYFFIGPFLILSFFLDCLFTSASDSESPKKSNLARITLIGALTSLATLINPEGFQGAILPFNILNEYGYTIAENQTLFFLADFFNFNLSIFTFKLSASALIIVFILTGKKLKNRIFEIIISIFFVYAGFRMLRNLPLYALSSFPVMAIILNDIFGKIKDRFRLEKSSRINPVLKITVSVFLILLIFLVSNNWFYKHINSSKAFGLSVPNGLERAVTFVKDNGIEGPMFNNFDIGGYLIGNLYPDEKVFVDNRPEAYSVKFFSEIYKPMQEDEKKWEEFSDKYNINFIFFGHADATPWGQDFLESIVKNPDWKTAYINEDVIIIVKNNIKNGDIISKFLITNINAANKITDHIRDSNKNRIDLNVDLSRFLYNIKWLEPVVYFADEAIKIDSDNPYPYLHKGLAYASYADKELQKLAAENIKKAIDLGLKDSRYYFILGGVYMNLGKFDEARFMFREALKRDKGNIQAREFLSKYFNE
ncbi:MAG: hypothetical protein UW43_C0001G0007 [Candidatus Yanofskybacteria bacterium GW2011_GWA1_44_21]|uniref:Uncharacterized protein n=2 Tax=Candidatus Yanofskyibacteriota TaxID=1752733 RepID=A0A1F8H080_9BACT|nr:MAG: hypothetical protein UV63_C0041G0003 [Microgenomates group bacterium GW2011_GWC1_43_11]KKT50842.1 MAG: hypothetical protein UW43_C0001G0007 [Candidatus Yanofskybacteria bacterium GW2011_GWA1_44_21]KKT90414.1 MAG: hypothetical protein UW90_C0001G0002 [Candidatus Yanofskybacteria bacterium GW2011_GWB1_45_11]OGN02586.1 MAG: hypothetical protein A2657_00380 [Candidatus Yanofskybacteria bacterium RIFCSPHIGHO2_01_FULL_44_110b]OGN14219.1 MAG: hypothetical protein A3C01_01315 [Candidatus Yanofs